jgi:hypothetical protein
MFTFYRIPTKHTHIFSGVVREEWINYIEERKAEGDYFQFSIEFILNKGYTPEETIRYIKEAVDYKNKVDSSYQEGEENG